MSSFTRRIQRAATRTYRKLGKGKGVFYEGRGRNLGVTNPKDKALIARLKREKRNAERKAQV